MSVEAFPREPDPVVDVLEQLVGAVQGLRPQPPTFTAAERENLAELMFRAYQASPTLGGRWQFVADAVADHLES